LQTFERQVFEGIVYRDCRRLKDWYLKGLYTEIADVWETGIWRDCIQGLQTFERLVFERIVYRVADFWENGILRILTFEILVYRECRRL